MHEIDRVVLFADPKVGPENTNRAVGNFATKKKTESNNCFIWHLKAINKSLIRG